jgi:hypothetical protein
MLTPQPPPDPLPALTPLRRQLAGAGTGQRSRTTATASGPAPGAARTGRQHQHMSTRPGQQPAPRGQHDRIYRHLADIAAALAADGIACRLTRLAGTPVLTIDAPGAGPDPVTIAVDPDTRAAPGLRLDCTCTWTPAPGTAPEAAAGAISAVLNALSPGPRPAAGRM